MSGSIAAWAVDGQFAATPCIDRGLVNHLAERRMNLVWRTTAIKKKNINIQLYKAIISLY
jgi:hypothetical protein